MNVTGKKKKSKQTKKMILIGDTAATLFFITVDFHAQPTGDFRLGRVRDGRKQLQRFRELRQRRRFVQLFVQERIPRGRICLPR